MPVLYTSEQLAAGDVPSVHALRQAPLFIHDTLQIMLAEGDIVGASSYGSLFMPDAPVTCASDCDWLVIFTSTERMLQSAPWRRLRRELAKQHIHFFIPALTLEQITTGNHTLCSLLHGLRRASRRIITGEDPLAVFARHGFEQNSVMTTLQLFGSFTRFFFEEYAHVFGTHLSQHAQIQLLNSAVSIWKDVLSTMLVRTIASRNTIPVNWEVYRRRYNGLIASAALDAGEQVALFLDEVRATMEEYDRLRHTGVVLADFAADYAVFLEENMHVVAAAAKFAEANIRLYREWATPMRFRPRVKTPSQARSDVYNGR